MFVLLSKILLLVGVAAISPSGIGIARGLRGVSVSSSLGSSPGEVGISIPLSRKDFRDSFLGIIGDDASMASSSASGTDKKSCFVLEAFAGVAWIRSKSILERGIAGDSSSVKAASWLRFLGAVEGTKEEEGMLLLSADPGPRK